MSKTLIEIPDDLLDEARAVVGPNASKAETVRTALTQMVRRRRQAATLDWFAASDAIGDLNNPDVRRSARR